MSWKKVVATGLATSILAPAAWAADPTPLTPEVAALYYHKVANDPLNFAEAAKRSPAVKGASTFDKPAAQQAEEDRLKAAQAKVDDTTPLSIHVTVSIGQYDLNAGRFPIEAFGERHYLSLGAFGNQYRIAFANGDGVGLKLPVDQARKFDNALGVRTVTANLAAHFVGTGDPTGNLNSQYTVRVAIDKITLRRLGGAEVLAEIIPDQAASASAATPPKAPSDWDVSGLKLGMTESELTSAAKATFADKKLVIGNDRDCGGGAAMYASGKMPLGAVCVVYTLAAGKVTSVTVRQVLADARSVFNDTRQALIAKYGPPAVSDRGRYFGWGQGVGRRPQDYPLYAGVDALATQQELDVGSSGTPVLSVTLTDMATLQAKAAQAPSAAKPVSPHL
ncbi:hypothetical protein [Nitrospirillum pindoramense]|uniref:Uncharacterized protein n=1 Tax=Nitrospirillum amazonense TaxID=28077 RepID=A0A560HAE7_9PROT|nr:hypothetical protein [Nitrospirillum amazonense]TWB42594.1 hypothetical protein FBZ90_106194 [Nitrospirillum amazonense]